jgi:hypothetical protein
MQDIRKPYTRSRSNGDLQSRVEDFESRHYKGDDYYKDNQEPVQIPLRKPRRDLRDMDMYPRRRKTDDEQDDELEEFYDEGPRTPPRSKPRKKISLKNAISIAVVVFLSVGAFTYTYVFNSAKIIITPKYKDVSGVSKTYSFSPSSDASAIPYELHTLSVAKEKTLTKSETKKVEAKASGKITVYNNFDSNPQRLIRNTRFEFPAGKIYRINQSIEVPGKKGDTPGSIEVTVYADNVGADYNLDSGNFSIPGFKGTEREKAFYGTVKTKIEGGASGTVNSVSVVDINAAKDSLALLLAKEIKEEATKVEKEGRTPLLGALQIIYEDNEEELLRGEGDVYKVTAKGYLPLASTPALAEALARDISDYEGHSVYIGVKDALTYTKKDTDTVTGTGTVALLVEGDVRIVWKSNVENLKDLVLGKDRDDFKPLMKTVDSVDSAEVRFSPLWLSSFPKESSKITVEEKNLKE